MKKLLNLILTFLCFSSVSLAQDIYVNVNATGSANNGSSWTDAFIDLQDAIDAATANQEIWVAAGTYFPSASPDDISTDPRDKSFHIGTDIKIYGGFDGTETALSQRDWTNNATILSGDIGTEGNNTDNSYHVFITANLTSAAVIDGFTVQDGNANGSSTISYASQSFHTYSGGGMYNYSSSPTFTNVTFLSNEAFNGGGMYNSYYSSPTLEHVIFSSNEATSTGSVGGDGGGVYNFNYSNPTFRNVMFTSNKAAYSGGGVCNSYYSSPTFQNVTFTSNKATTNGGGVCNSNFSSPAFQNVTFSSNEATSNGGGVYNSSYSSPTLQNVTFSSNEATSNGGGMYNFSSSPKLINTLFFKNTASSGADVYLSSSSIASESSNNASDASNISGTRTVDLSGLYYKDIIVDSTDLDGPDDVWMTADDGLIITGNSILKDAGTATGAPSEDITGYTRPSPPSIGAYEYNPCLFAASVVYVDLAATGNGTGTSWANAYTDLQDALDARMACTGVDTILVAEGTYYPTSSPVGITTDARDRAFYLVDSNVVILGGYSASAGTPIGAATILSGDLVTAGTATDSAYHVFITAGLTLATVLDNVTITASEANGSSYIVYGSYNFFQYSGGGMYNYSSSPKLTNVTFTVNKATYGGGMYNVFSSLKLTNVTFSANTADEGGGMHNNTSSPSMVNVTFTDNTATYGGGMYNVSSSPKLTNLTFASNTASNSGGGLYNNSSSSPIVTNCIFWRNIKAGSTTASGADIENLSSSTPTVSFTSLQTYSSGINCITGDPLFVDATDADGADNVWMTADDGLRLLIGSPAIDAGSYEAIPAGITTDITGAARVQNTTVNMGAYEGVECSPTTTFYVDSTITASGDGSSWNTAFKTLSEAIDRVCTSTDSILVAAGTYLPTSKPTGELTADPRDVTFYLNQDIVLLGGYPSGGGTRDAAANPTILSGDIGTAGDSTDNSYHVFITANLTSATLIDGFTVRDGNANFSAILFYTSKSFNRDRGGGMYNASSSPTINNVTFTANMATNGGGMFNNDSSPNVTNVTFVSNTATVGGGMSNISSSSPTVTNVTFMSNSAVTTGGGMFNDDSSPNVTNVTFASNTAIVIGGGMYNGNASPTVTNVTFASNTADYGGGMYNSSSSPSVTNVTFASNTASYYGGGLYSYSSSPTVTNSIFWDNLKGTSTTVAGADIENLSSSPMVTYTSLQSYTGGTGSINVDPLFVDAANGDYRLKACSPAIDKGTTDTTGLNLGLIDLVGNPRVLDGRIDMGAYEGASVGLATATDLLTWTGAVNTVWNNACNWSPAGIPTATNDVVIPGGMPNQPTLTINNAVASTVEVKNGATFT